MSKIVINYEEPLTFIVKYYIIYIQGGRKMYNYKEIVSDTELFITFKPNPTVKDRLDAVSNVGEVLGWVQIHDAVFDTSSPDIFTQYKLWQTRPERAVGKPIPMENKSVDELMTAYEEVLIGAYILKHPEQRVEHKEGHRLGYEIMIDWLRSTDFYRAPASTIYHESYVGGLLAHSIKVYNEALALQKAPQFKDVDVVSVALTALTHDWCKIDLYESYMKNVKNEKTGQWEKVPGFKHNPKGVPLGHGVTSMYLVQNFFRLSLDEALAIRWHMGKWNVADNEINDLQRANELYPLVHLLQFADQLSITKYSTTREGMWT